MVATARIAEKVYSALPVPGQNLALSVFGLGYRWARMGGGFRRYVGEFAERENWEPERLKKYSEERLRALLLRALASSPHYRKRWTELGLEEGDFREFRVEDLPRLPVTSKAELRADPLGFLASPNSSKRGLTQQHTSGSTGVPVTIFMSREAERRTVAAREARSFNWAGVSLHEPRATLGARLIVPGDNPSPPFYRYNLVEHQIYLSSFHLGPKNVISYVEGLNRHRPQVLTGMANSYCLLARLMLQQGLKLDYSPRAAILGSEKVTPRTRETVEEAFSTRVFEEYGSVENCVLATECEAGRLHVSPDFGILEIIDRHGGPAAPGVPGKLVCTGLINYDQPLIRYEIGDLGAWSGEDCPCGRLQFPVLHGIVGRLYDVLTLADGRQISGVDEVFSGVDGIAEGQVVQHSVRRFTLRLVPTTAFDSLQEEQLVRALKTRVGNVEVTVERVPEIERTSAGKIRLVVSHVSPWSPADEVVPTE